MPAIKGRYTKAELLKKGPQTTYRGKALSQIAFPLGGIGTGCISIGGWGQLRDWEIMNRPAKGFSPPNSFFAIKIRQEGREPRLRALIGQPTGDFVGDGHSMPRNSGEGLPCFQKASFKGEYPFAFVRLEDPELPVRVVIEAFSPLIPLNDRDSGIPVAILIYRVRNSSRNPIEVSLYGSITNFVGGPGSAGQVNEDRSAPGMIGLFLGNTRLDPASPQAGSLALVTPWEEGGVWPRWPDGPANLWKFWEAIALSDKFPPPAGGTLSGLELEALIVNVSQDWNPSITQPWYAYRDLIPLGKFLIKYGAMPIFLVVTAGLAYRVLEARQMLANPLAGFSTAAKTALGAVVLIPFALFCPPFSLAFSVWPVVEAFWWIQWYDNIVPAREWILAYTPFLAAFGFVVPAVWALCFSMTRRKTESESPSVPRLFFRGRFH